MKELRVALTVLQEHIQVQELPVALTVLQEHIQMQELPVALAVLQEHMQVQELPVALTVLQEHIQVLVQTVVLIVLQVHTQVKEVPVVLIVFQAVTQDLEPRHVLNVLLDIIKVSLDKVTVNLVLLGHFRHLLELLCAVCALQALISPALLKTTVMIVCPIWCQMRDKLNVIPVLLATGQTHSSLLVSAVQGIQPLLLVVLSVRHVFILMS